MRILLGLLNHWISWICYFPCYWRITRLVWTTISWLLWFIWKPRMQRRIDGPSFLIHWEKPTYYRRCLSIYGCWSIMRYLSWISRKIWSHQLRWCCLRQYCSIIESCYLTTHFNCSWCRNLVILFRWCLLWLQWSIGPRCLGCWLWYQIELDC